VQTIKVRSPSPANGLRRLRRCYGRDLARGHLVNIGEAVGVIAAQSIGEPGTQLTMRTFHIGGAASRAAAVDSVTVKSTGSVTFSNLKSVEHANGAGGMSRSGEISVLDAHGRERERHKLPYGATITSKDGDAIKAGQTVANWDPHTHPIITEVAGSSVSRLEDGITVIEQTDEVTGLSTRVVIDPKRRGSQAKDLRPLVRSSTPRATTCRSRAPTCRRSTCCRRARSSTCRTAQVGVGDVLARIPQEASRPATSPVVCRAWPSCSKRASRRIRRCWPRFGHHQLRQGHQGQAAPDHHRHRWFGARRPDPEVPPGDRVRRRACQQGRNHRGRRADPHDILRLLGVERWRPTS
jgi:DNA-directed RNA polymerase subunit beta'